MKANLHPRTIERVREDNPGADEEMLDHYSHASIYAFGSVEESVRDLGRALARALMNDRWALVAVYLGSLLIILALQMKGVLR